MKAETAVQLPNIASDAKVIYLDDLLTIVSTFERDVAAYGPGCESFEWSDLVKKMHRERSSEPLPSSLAGIVHFYETSCTEKKGSCSKHPEETWTCSLAISDGHEFAIELRFELDQGLTIRQNTLSCSYAG